MSRKRGARRSRPPSLGPLQPGPGAEATEIRVSGSSPDEAVASSLADAFGGSPSEVRWIQVQGFSEATDLEVVGRGLGLGPDQLGALLFSSQPVVELPEDGGCQIGFRALQPGPGLHTVRVAIVARGNLVATFEEHKGPLLDAVRAELPRVGGRLRQRGADYLVYRLLDTIVDGNLPHIDTIADRLDEIEDQVAVRFVKNALEELHTLRRGLRTIRRRGTTARRVISDLLREGDDWIDPRTRPYLASLADQATHVEDLAVHYRDVATDISELVVGMANVRMNEVMRLLAVLSTIFMPLSFLAGIWGMNFEVMPELKWAYGYPLALGIMGSAAAALLLWFRRQGWTHRPSPLTDDGRPPAPPDFG